MQQATREREIIAQRDRRRASRRVGFTPQDIADELWFEHQSDLDLLQFPEDFVARANEGDVFDLPSGEVQVGVALIHAGDLLRVGTIRVGGRDGEVIDVGSVSAPGSWRLCPCVTAQARSGCLATRYATMPSSASTNTARS